MSQKPLTDAQLIALAARAMHALPDAPPAWIEAAAALFPAEAPAPTAAPGLGAVVAATVARLQAALRFDSWAPQPALALRASRGDTRQLLFTAGECDIDLRIGPAEQGRHPLAGQVLGPGIDEARVVIARADGPGTALAEATLDSLGEFAFAALEAGEIQLRLERAGLPVIELPPVRLGPPPRA